MPIPRYYLGVNVFDEAVDRMARLYQGGHRVIVSFSGGKDSGVCLEISLIAAREANRLPIEVVMRDDEIMLPGTFEYCERVAAREEVDFHWIIANQPVINLYNRKSPYFFVFDPSLAPEKWVRQPPDFAEYIPQKFIEAMVLPSRFPPAEGKDLISVIGMRTQESNRRTRGLYSSKGYMTKPNRYGVRYARPIYDWTDGDVWKAHKDFEWDYNSVYSVLNRLGMSRRDLRIAPPTQTLAAMIALPYAAKAFPRWFDTVCDRLDGVRTASMFGKRAITPLRQLGESWKDCFWRECVETAPEWIADRAKPIAEYYEKLHARHSSMPLPDVITCDKCSSQLASWRQLANTLYMGDPFSFKQDVVPPVEPNYFCTGTGTWEGGKPSF